MDLLGITRLSKSQVSVMAADLDEQVAVFRTRPLHAGPYLFVAADALTLKVREGGRVVLAEQHDEWTEGRRHLGLDALARARAATTPGTTKER